MSQDEPEFLSLPPLSEDLKKYLAQVQSFRDNAWRAMAEACRIPEELIDFGKTEETKAKKT